VTYLLQVIEMWIGMEADILGDILVQMRDSLVPLINSLPSVRGRKFLAFLEQVCGIDLVFPLVRLFCQTNKR
jgi:hypothetical protein